MGRSRIAAVAVSEDIVSRSERKKDLATAIQEAARGGADTVVFPECALSHRTTEGIAAYVDEKSAVPMARAVDDPEIEELRTVAAGKKLTLVFNTEELDGGKVYNTTFFFAPDGVLLGRYRKHFLPAGEKEVGISPGEYLLPVETPAGRVGTFVCWELHFPEVCVRHLLEGADLFLWITMPFGNMPMGAANRVAGRAADLASPLVAVTYARPTDREQETDIICTMAADSYGRIIGAAPQIPGVYCFDVDPGEEVRMRVWGTDGYMDRRAYTVRQRSESGIVRGK
ncbi:MAG: carbon-nitrogen hydrolase family protein [Planctomycetes bacterium]|nr:carbon-nitrogen hydrolase family protein [Planctomycetota bacterium]